jgi:hypothetical protein
MAIQGSQLATVIVFPGDTGLVAEAWIASVDRAIAQFQWEDGPAAAAMKNKLSGTAASWLRAQEKVGRALETWTGVNGLKSALQTRFSETISELAAADAIRDLKQKSNESVNEFYDRVVLAVDRKNHTYTPAQKTTADYRAAMMADVFIFFGAGLREEIRNRTLGTPTPPLTAEALLNAARAIEVDMTRQAAQRQLLEVSTNVVPEDNSSLEHQIAELRQQISSWTISRGRGGRQGPPMANRGRGGQRDISQVQCFRCKNWGHYANKCPSRQDGKTSSRGRFQQGRFGSRSRGDRNGTRSDRPGQSWSMAPVDSHDGNMWRENIQGE